MNLTQILEDASAAGGTDTFRLIKGNLTQTNVTGWNNIYLMDLQVGGSSKISVNNSGNTAIAGTLAVTEATTLSGALVANGGITCDTDKFTVADGTGDTAIAGTLGVTGAATISSNILAHKAQTVTAQIELSADTLIPTTAGGAGVVNTDTTLVILDSDAADKQIFLPAPTIVGIGHTVTIVNYTAQNVNIVCAQDGLDAATINGTAVTTTDNKTLEDGQTKNISITDGQAMIAAVTGTNNWTIFRISANVATPPTPN